MSKSELCSRSNPEIMARFKSIAQSSSPEPGLEFKIPSLLIDALVLWIVTIGELIYCDREKTGLLPGFTFGWQQLVTVVSLYLFLSIFILTVKYLCQARFILYNSPGIEASPWCQLILRLIYDIITIIMCMCFIAGDNLLNIICIDLAIAPESSCIEQSSQPLKVNESCMAIVSQDKEALSENSTGLSQCDVSMCRKGSVGLLGISLVLHLALMYCGHSFKSSLKGLPKVGSDHGWLTKAFSLLSLLLLFDQSLSGLHESIFEGTRNSTLCSDDTHISGGFIYGISVAVWVFFYIVHCFQYCMSKHKRKWCTTLFYHVILILILVLYCVFIFADTPWPWECFDLDPLMKRAGLQGRSALLTISVTVLLLLYIAYISISCIPSLKVYRKKHIILGSEFQQMFTSIAKHYDPIEVENAENLFVRSEVDETSASYTIFMTRDDDWISELCGGHSSNNTNTIFSNSHSQPMRGPGRAQTSTTESPIVGAYVKIGAGKDANENSRQSTHKYVAEAKYLKKQPQEDSGDPQQQDGIVTLDSFPKDSVISGFISKDITLNLPGVLRDGTVIRERKL